MSRQKLAMFFPVGSGKTRHRMSAGALTDLGSPLQLQITPRSCGGQTLTRSASEALCRIAALESEASEVAGTSGYPEIESRCHD